jgi:hypothetical protein
MKESGQLHAPDALSQGNSLPVTIRWRAQGTVEISEMSNTDGQTDRAIVCFLHASRAKNTYSSVYRRFLVRTYIFTSANLNISLDYLSQ